MSLTSLSRILRDAMKTRGPSGTMLMQVDDIVDELRDSYHELEQLRWRPCEQPPEVEQGFYQLACDDHPMVIHARYGGSNGWFYRGMQILDPYAWRPIPAKPDKETP